MVKISLMVIAGALMVMVSGALLAAYAPDLRKNNVLPENVMLHHTTFRIPNDFLMA